MNGAKKAFVDLVGRLPSDVYVYKIEWFFAKWLSRMQLGLNLLLVITTLNKQASAPNCQEELIYRFIYFCLA